MARKQTRFVLCESHDHLQSEGRRRLAEIFCEGGPAHGKACAPQLCELYPGTDLYSATFTDEQAAELIAAWQINTSR